MSIKPRAIFTINHEDYLLDSSICLDDGFKILGKLTLARPHYFTNSDGRSIKEWISMPTFTEATITVVDASRVDNKKSEDQKMTYHCN